MITFPLLCLCVLSGSAYHLWNSSCLECSEYCLPSFIFLIFPLLPVSILSDRMLLRLWFVAEMKMGNFKDRSSLPFAEARCPTQALPQLSLVPSITFLPLPKLSFLLLVLSLSPFPHHPHPVAVRYHSCAPLPSILLSLLSVPWQTVSACFDVCSRSRFWCCNKPL